MKALRSSPFLPVACLLQAVIFSCCVIGPEAAAGAAADRQLFMKALRSSPFLSPACLLQSVIFDCWLFCANATGEASRPPRTSAAIADWIFMGHSIVVERYWGSCDRASKPSRAHRRHHYGKAVRQNGQKHGPVDTRP